MSTPHNDREYARAVGARLRAIRQQQGLSLQGVEVKSRGRWKMAAIGSYERGDRMIGVETLSDLAHFYGVPVAELLADGEPVAPRPVGRPAVIDLGKLAGAPEVLRAWVARIQRLRGDYNGRVLTVRAADLDALGLLFDVGAGGMRGLLAEWGVLAAGGPRPEERRYAAVTGRTTTGGGTWKTDGALHATPGDAAARGEETGGRYAVAVLDGAGRLVDLWDVDLPEGGRLYCPRDLLADIAEGCGWELAPETGPSS